MGSDSFSGDVKSALAYAGAMAVPCVGLLLPDSWTPIAAMTLPLSGPACGELTIRQPYTFGQGLGVRMLGLVILMVSASSVAHLTLNDGATGTAGMIIGITAVWQGVFITALAAIRAPRRNAVTNDRDTPTAPEIGDRGPTEPGEPSPRSRLD